MEPFKRQLCGQYRIDRWRAINTYVKCDDAGITLEASGKTALILYSDIIKVNSMKLYLQPGRLICMWLSSGEYVVLHVYHDKLFEEWITKNNQSIAIDHFRIPFWANSPFFLWILSAVIWAGFTMQATANNYGWLKSFAWSAVMVHAIFTPILAWVTYLIIKLFPPQERMAALARLWLIPIFGIGDVGMKIMDCYGYLRDRDK